MPTSCPMRYEVSRCGPTAHRSGELPPTPALYYHTSVLMMVSSKRLSCIFEICACQETPKIVCSSLSLSLCVCVCVCVCVHACVCSSMDTYYVPPWDHWIGLHCHTCLSGLNQLSLLQQKVLDVLTFLAVHLQWMPQVQVFIQPLPYVYMYTIIASCCKYFTR